MNKNSDTFLIIFVKNPIHGKVKNRLAKTIGDEKALDIYIHLLKYTSYITSQIDCDKAVFYSDFTEDSDLWDNNKYQKCVQEGADMGERMFNAFSLAFNKGYKKIVLISSDYIDLTSELIQEAFSVLNEGKCVLGHSKDGGYYLIGLNILKEELFNNKKWRSEDVLLDTLIDFQKSNIPYRLLTTLSDIEEEEGLLSLKNY